MVEGGSEEDMMRLEPIEHPESLKMRLAYAYAKRRFGKVITPMKVVYARIPEVLAMSKAMATFMESGMVLEPGLRLLIMHLVGTRNQCGFCMDISRAQWISSGGVPDKFDAIEAYATSPLFSDSERAALAYAEEVNRTRDASDETFEALRRHFNEREIVEITWCIAAENFYNFLNRPMGIESDGLCALAEAKKKEGAVT